MPVVIPGPATGTEGLVLDGLNLAQGEGGAIRLDAFTPPIPKKRPEWIEAADSDGAILARDPLVSNGQATVRVAVVGASRNDAQDIIGDLVDKIEKADRTPAGIPLVWTPSDSTLSLTFYVLSGEVTELPVDWESGYMVNQPLVTFTLDCLPYGYGTPVTYTKTATAGPLVTMDLATVPGDAPALGVLTVTDASSQSRRTVEWGAEQLHYNPISPTALVLDSDSLVTTGFAGTQTTLTGAYDPNATGNSIITSTVATGPQAICGTGAQPHVGTFRVKARVNTGTGGITGAYVRFAWRAGDGDYATNDPITLTDAAQEFREIDLGLVTIPDATAGTQTWDGRVESWVLTGSDTILIDYLMLIPVEAGYGKAQASYSYTPGVIVARDSYTGTTAGGALNARTADVGGAWATSGSATDFTFIDVGPLEGLQRTTGTEAGSGRFALLGTSVYTNTEVSTEVNAAAIGAYAGLVLRYVDATHYVTVTARRTSIDSGLLEVTKMDGTATVIGQANLTGLNPYFAGAIRVVAFSSGRLIATAIQAAMNGATVEAYDATLATGGSLASGKAGLFDYQPASSTAFRQYDNFQIATPATEPIVLYSGRSLQVRHDDTLRESSGGGTWGRPQSYRGSRFKVQPAGDAARTTRVAVKASRNDLDSAEDANLTDTISLAATVTPRYSVVPRA